MTEPPFRQSAAAESWQFLCRWARNPAGIGAIAPSGPWLATAMAAGVGPARPGVIVELGAGTGRITRALVARAERPADVVVVEREPSFCALLARRFPDIRVLEGDARDLRRLTAAAGIGEVSHVVSGLPLLAMPVPVRDAIAAEAFAALPADGRMVQFTYGPQSPVPAETVAAAGFVGRRTRWVLRNLPPAAVWVYSRAGGTVS